MILLFMALALLLACEVSSGRIGEKFENDRNGTLVCDVPEVTILAHVAYQFVDVISSVDTAVEEMNVLYDRRFQLRVDPLTAKTKFFCEQLQDETADVAASFYYRKSRCAGTIVFLSPYCTADFVMLARMTAEWNVPVLSILGSFPSESIKYPTAVAAAPTHNAVFAAFLKRFLLFYKWTTIFLLCDDKRDVGYFRANCDNFKQQLTAPTFKVRFINFDSGVGPVDYNYYLSSVRKAARVVFLLCRSEIARTFLLLAQAKNMTNNDYVFLFAQPYTMPPSFPDLTWLETGNEFTSQTLSVVLYITYDNEDVADKLLTTTVENIRRKIVESQTSNFSATATLAAITVSAYLAVALMAKVINETVGSSNYSTSVEALQDGAALTQRLLNRTFVVPGGNIYFSPTGQRHVDMLVKQYSFMTGRFESTLRYVHRSASITFPFGRRSVWNGGKPASAEPVCGFENDKCQSNNFLSETVPAVVVVGLIVGSSLLVTWWWNRRSQSDDGRPWWQLERMDVLTRNKRKSVFSTMHASAYLRPL